MSKFKKGLFLGGLLGAGAMWLYTTKQGEDLRNKAYEHGEEVYSLVKEKIKESDAYKSMSEKEYVQKVRELVDDYSKEKSLSSATKEMIVTLVGGHWDRMKKDIEDRGEGKLMIDQ